MSNEPKFRVWTVNNYGQGRERKPRWTECGACWETRNGYLKIQLEALPLNGQLLLLPPNRPSPDDDEAEDQTESQADTDARKATVKA